MSQMRMIPQVMVVAVLCVVAVPLAAVFLPATRPWIDAVGLLRPMSAMGLVSAAPAPDAASAGRPGGPAGGVVVVAGSAVREPRRDVVSAIGSARGVQYVNLSFEVTGRMMSLQVLPGERVAAGDVIAELDDEAARLVVDRARLVLEDAQRTLTRLEQLSGSGTTTISQTQDAELALRTADLALQSAERDLANHRLLAPVAGHVGLIEPQVGDLVSSSTTITRIEDRSSLIIDFRVPERIAPLVSVGDMVRATPVSAPDAAIEGRIVAVDNRVDEVSRTLRVQAAISNTDDALRAGMAFEINLEFTGAAFPAVNPLAIQWGADGAFVWIVRAGKAERLPTRILQRNADTVLIDAVLDPADLVVTEGVQALRPGVDVTIAQPES